MNQHINWSPGVTLEAIEKQVILRAFSFYHGNKTTTSQSLGISIRTLDAKLEKYDLESKEEEKAENERRRKNEEFGRRQRGEGGYYTPTASGDPQPPKLAAPTAKRSEDGDSAAAGPRVESAQGATAKPAVPLPERSKVQTVLPQPHAQGGTRRSR